MCTILASFPKGKQSYTAHCLPHNTRELLVYVLHGKIAGPLETVN